MKVLVAGGGGFIGSHVSEELLRRGHEVFAFDNFSDYYNPERKRANIEEVRAFAPEGRFRFQEMDVRDRDALASLFEKNPFDVVVNLAAMPGVRASIENPYLYYDVNLTGTLNLLLECLKRKIGRFVLASTSSAYGNTETIPFVETDPCDRPLAPYAASKRAAEMLAFTYHHLYGIDTTVLRFFTVYGPRGRPDMMAHKILDNIFQGKQCPLYNGGDMWRDWTYVGDIAQGVANAAERSLGYEIINLGRGEMVKVSEFLEISERLAGKKARLDPAPKMDADVDRTFADIEKAERLLDYRPQVSVKEGVARFLEWYRKAVIDS